MCEIRRGAIHPEQQKVFKLYLLHQTSINGNLPAVLSSTNICHCLESQKAAISSDRYCRYRCDIYIAMKPSIHAAQKNFLRSNSSMPTKMYRLSSSHLPVSLQIFPFQVSFKCSYSTCLNYLLMQLVLYTHPE